MRQHPVGTLLTIVVFVVGVGLSSYFGHWIATTSGAPSWTIVGFWLGTLVCALAASIPAVFERRNLFTQVRSLTSDVRVLERALREIADRK